MTRQPLVKLWEHAGLGLDLISIDRSRLAESHEAWVYVTLEGEQDTDVPLYAGLGPYPRSGVLTWTNGD